MTPQEFDSLNNPEYRCYAVYDVTFYGKKYIERGLILSTILESTAKIPFIQVDTAPKRVLLSVVRDIVVSRVKWLPVEKMNLVDLISIEQEDS